MRACRSSSLEEGVGTGTEAVAVGAVDVRALGGGKDCT